VLRNFSERSGSSRSRKAEPFCRERLGANMSLAQRFNDIPPDEMSDEQRQVVKNATSGLRGSVPAPMRPWLVSPAMAQLAQQLGEFLRYQTVLGPCLSELAILVTARFWTSQYEWFVHAKIAREAGLSEMLINAIAVHETPTFTNPAERIVYQAAQSIHRNHGLDDALYAEARDILGEQGLAELVGVLGYYTLVSMTLNVYGIGVPEGIPNPLKPV
jgi:4-carboxymuconolactone decarboxylase